MYLRDTAMYRWTDSGTETLLTSPAVKGKSEWQVDIYDDLAFGGTYSEEHWLAMKYIDARTHTKISNARITKLHGTYQTGHVLNAGYTNVWAAPKAAGAASTIATDAVPSNLADNFHGPVADALEIETYDVTDAEYQFLVMQHELTSVARAADPEKQVGTSGYALIEFAYKITDMDNDRTAVPGGNDSASIFGQTQIDVYVVINGEQQFFGCTENAVTAGFGVEWDNIVKGAVNGVQSKFLTTRTNELSGNLMSLNIWNWINFLYGTNYSSNGTSTRVNVSSSWKPVQAVEVIMDTVSRYGQRLTIHATEAFLKTNGDIPMGSGPAMMPWIIDLGESVNIWMTDDYWDIHRFWVDIELT
jgi:hypothetical protein